MGHIMTKEWSRGIASVSQSVAVKSHSHRTVGVSGMDIVLWTVKIVADDIDKGFVSVLIATVGIAFYHCQVLVTGYLV